MLFIIIFAVLEYDCSFHCSLCAAGDVLLSLYFQFISLNLYCYHNFLTLRYFITRDVVIGYIF